MEPIPDAWMYTEEFYSSNTGTIMCGFTVFNLKKSYISCPEARGQMKDALSLVGGAVFSHNPKSLTKDHNG